jgi:hypothetical protein
MKRQSGLQKDVGQKDGIDKNASSQAAFCNSAVRLDWDCAEEMQLVPCQVLILGSGGGWVAGVGASSRNPGASFAKPQSSPGHPTPKFRTDKALENDEVVLAHVITRAASDFVFDHSNLVCVLDIACIRELLRRMT